MADDFAYLNARVRVRRGTLLKESFFQEALDLSFADFLRLLSETVYGGALAGQGLPDVDRAVLRTQAKLVGDLPRLEVPALFVVGALTHKREDARQAKTQCGVGLASASCSFRF
mgnify:CR=1 FL=1